MDSQFWDKIFHAATLLLSGGAIFKVLNYYIHKDKIKAAAEKERAEAESIRLRTSEQLLKNVMDQLRDVRNENISQLKEMSEMRLLHVRELDDERRSCANAMQLMNERIRELEAKLSIR